MRFRLPVVAFAATLALAACSGPPTPKEVAVPGVASVPLTSPWKEMNLPIDGGVVVISNPEFLVVRFPATPADALKGLGGAVQDALVLQGWTVVEYEPRKSLYYNAQMRMPDGRGADVSATPDRGHPNLSISIDQ